jgi:hypothetical protein
MIDNLTKCCAFCAYYLGEREYYEKQFATLRSFEEVDSLEESNEINEDEELAEQIQSEFAMKISNYANIVLLALKVGSSPAFQFLCMNSCRMIRLFGPTGIRYNKKWINCYSCLNTGFTA